MTTPQHALAIQSALENKWEEAIAINEEILAENERDLDTLNRLAYAYFKLGEFKKSKAIYNKVVEIDKTNPIANKNLKKLASLGEKGSTNSTFATNHMENVFIQEAGKTKTVELINVADKKTLLMLQHGDEVHLTIKRSKIFIQTPDKTFIGMLPDSLGLRLTNFMEGGNEYQACVKGIDDKSITIFIKETKRVKKFINQSSF